MKEMKRDTTDKKLVLVCKLFLCVLIRVHPWLILQFLAGGGLGRGVHAVLGNFVDAALWGLLMGAVEMVEGTGAFAD